MKRYRIIQVNFDTRPNILRMEIKEDWEEKVKQNWRANKEKLKQEFIDEFGCWGKNIKLQNFIDLGASPLSIIAFHGKFLQQIRISFIVGSYYPALTSSCALGERILNHLMLKLKNHFKHTDQYKKIYRKNSFSDWGVAIDTLVAWDVLLPKVADNLRKLEKLRNKVIHFNPEIDNNDRKLALDAILLLQDIIYEQFGAGPGDYLQPWFIENSKDAFFIKKEWESKPFIKKIYLPHCVLVGPQHTMSFVDGIWEVNDIDYDEKEITDQEFLKLLENPKNNTNDHTEIEST